MTGETEPPKEGYIRALQVFEVTNKKLNLELATTQRNYQLAHQKLTALELRTKQLEGSLAQKDEQLKERSRALSLLVDQQEELSVMTRKYHATVQLLRNFESDVAAREKEWRDAVLAETHKRELLAARLSGSSSSAPASQTSTLRTATTHSPLVVPLPSPLHRNLDNRLSSAATPLRPATPITTATTFGADQQKLNDLANEVAALTKKNQFLETRRAELEQQLVESQEARHERDYRISKLEREQLTLKQRDERWIQLTTDLQRKLEHVRSTGSNDVEHTELAPLVTLLVASQTAEQKALHDSAQAQALGVEAQANVTVLQTQLATLKRDHELLLVSNRTVTEERGSLLKRAADVKEEAQHYERQFQTIQAELDRTVKAKLTLEGKFTDLETSFASVSTEKNFLQRQVEELRVALGEMGHNTTEMREQLNEQSRATRAAMRGKEESEQATAKAASELLTEQYRSATLAERVTLLEATQAVAVSATFRAENIASKTAVQHAALQEDFASLQRLLEHEKRQSQFFASSLQKANDSAKEIAATMERAVQLQEESAKSVLQEQEMRGRLGIAQLEIRLLRDRVSALDETVRQLAVAHQLTLQRVHLVAGLNEVPDDAALSLQRVMQDVGNELRSVSQLCHEALEKGRESNLFVQSIASQFHGSGMKPAIRMLGATAGGSLTNTALNNVPKRLSIATGPASEGSNDSRVVLAAALFDFDVEEALRRSYILQQEARSFSTYLWSLVSGYRRVAAVQRSIKSDFAPVVRALSMSAVSVATQCQRMVNRMTYKDHSVRTYDTNAETAVATLVALHTELHRFFSKAQFESEQSERLALHMLQNQLSQVQAQQAKLRYDRERLPILDLITQEAQRTAHTHGSEAQSTGTPCVECCARSIEIANLHKRIEELETLVAVRVTTHHHEEENDAFKERDSTVMMHPSSVLDEVHMRQRLRVECTRLERRLHEAEQLHAQSVRRLVAYFEGLLTKLHHLMTCSSFDMLVALLFQRLAHQALAASSMSRLHHNPLLHDDQNDIEGMDTNNLSSLEELSLPLPVASGGRAPRTSNVVVSVDDLRLVPMANASTPPPPPHRPSQLLHASLSSSLVTAPSSGNPIAEELVRRYSIMAFQHAEATGRALLERDSFQWYGRLLQDHSHYVQRHLASLLSKAVATAQSSTAGGPAPAEDYVLLKREYDHKLRACQAALESSNQKLVLLIRSSEDSDRAHRNAYLQLLESKREVEKWKANVEACQEEIRSLQQQAERQRGLPQGTERLDGRATIRNGSGAEASALATSVSGTTPAFSESPPPLSAPQSGSTAGPHATTNDRPWCVWRGSSSALPPPASPVVDSVKVHRSSPHDDDHDFSTPSLLQLSPIPPSMPTKPTTTQNNNNNYSNFKDEQETRMTVADYSQAYLNAWERRQGDDDATNAMIPPFTATVGRATTTMESPPVNLQQTGSPNVVISQQDQVYENVASLQRTVEESRRHAAQKERQARFELQIHKERLHDVVKLVEKLLVNQKKLRLLARAYECQKMLEEDQFRNASPFLR